MFVSSAATQQNRGDVSGEGTNKKSSRFVLRLLPCLAPVGAVPIVEWVEPLSLGLPLAAVWIGAASVLVWFVSRKVC